MLNFIKTSDLVKFAKYMPQKKDEGVFLSSVENFIKANSNTEEEGVN